MELLKQLQKKLKSIPVAHFIREAFNESRDVIEDMNAEQLQQGLRADGEEIRPKYRNPLYAEYKQFKNSKPTHGTPDLRDTGAFYKGIKAVISGDTLELKGTDEKTEMLQEKYKDSIIGLSEGNVEELKEGYIKPILRDKTLNYLAK